MTAYLKWYQLPYHQLKLSCVNYPCQVVFLQITKRMHMLHLYLRKTIRKTITISNLFLDSQTWHKSPRGMFSCLCTNTTYGKHIINMDSGYKYLDSTINQLIILCHKIYESLEKCFISFDASTAFDRYGTPASYLNYNDLEYLIHC